MPSLDMLLLKGPANGDIPTGLADLRYQILSNGIPANNDGMSELRIYVWLVLLCAPPIRTDVYLDLVRQGASPSYSKIRNDTFRTLATDPLFRRRVTENSLTRVLNAVAWKLFDAHEAKVNGWQSPPTLSAFDGEMGSIASRSSIDRQTEPEEERKGSEAPEQIGYVQGMNVLAAPFLYAARSEAEAFAAFERTVTKELPGYIRPDMGGVHRGLALVDTVLEIVDYKLWGYLMQRGMKAEIWAFASVLTLCACTPPLPEVLRLWDFLFAYGLHMNILAIVAQLVLARDQILSSPSPNQILHKLPPLQAKKIINLAVSFAPKIPADIYQHIIDHAK